MLDDQKVEQAENLVALWKSFLNFAHEQDRKEEEKWYALSDKEKHLTQIVYMHRDFEQFMSWLNVELINASQPKE